MSEPRRPTGRNEVALRMRKDREWSQDRLAAAMQETGRRLGIKGVPTNRGTIIREIGRVERGQIAVPDDMYLRLWCAVFDVQAADLFGHLETMTGSGAGGDTYAVTSHQFIPAHLGCDAVHQLWQSAEPASGQWAECRRIPLHHDTGTAELYLWPIGVGVIHLRQDLEPRSVAELAVWRRNSYPAARAWVDTQLAKLGAPTASAYVFSLYWLTRSCWTGPTLDAAVRLLSMPKHLLDRDDATCSDAELLSAGQMVERELLRDGIVERPDLTSFGARGVSIGYASWSGVAYHPVAPRRALAVDEIVACELMTQAVWCYTDAIVRQVEAGQDPVVPDAYGWRWLRGIRSRLTSPRAEEVGQHQTMREAIIATSKLDQQIHTAIDALRTGV
ncbi:XRE family transcriptional regulator [Actinoplanes sp. NPDC051494]|uniref:XRE family transcriptional regulator n=1 Tax=Actinoplanes sp. NPDC051494 TaxID=3363907 RepID=UPI0037AF419B